MDRWDIVLALVAGYVAVMALVRMMARRRDQDVAEVQRQLDSLRGDDNRNSRLNSRDAA
jgi:hypothetical protein